MNIFGNAPVYTTRDPRCSLRARGSGEHAIYRHAAEFHHSTQGSRVQDRGPERQFLWVNPLTVALRYNFPIFTICEFRQIIYVLYVINNLSRDVTL